MSNRLVNLAWSVPLPPSTKLLLIALADRGDKGGKSWPSRQMLSTQTGLSTASISRHLNELIEAGLVAQQRRRQRSAEYVVDEQALMSAAETLATVVDFPTPEDSKKAQSDTSQIDTSQIDMYQPDDQDVSICDIPKENPQRTPNKRTSKRASTTPADGFDAFWSAYPRKVGKQPAIKAYAAAVKLVAPAALLAAIKVHSAYWAKAGRDTEGIPHPATWLHQRRWEDELGLGVAGSDPVEWLRGQWQAGSVTEILKIYSAGYSQPAPGTGDYWAEVLKPHNRAWITEHRDQILARLTREAS